jgi:tetratricopeptide (TPR) repeat protein
LGRQKVLAEAKMDLADIYLLNGEPWESILLYGQVEREFKDQPLGYTAKLKSAKLSYYKGEFELAQGHLDVLKLATSREIANDALDLSILIKNNTVFDSTDVAMQAYANIELMLFQNQKEEAIVAMDSMLVKFQGHSLSDELLLLKAQTLRELGNFEVALASLEIINTIYYYDILGDDAFFLAAKILDRDLNRTDEAMARYNTMLTKFPGSIYISEARQRFRELRGDFNN